MTDLPKRKEIRLKGYDYSQNGAYFITICVKDKRKILWENVRARIARPRSPRPVGAVIGRPSLSDVGEIVEYAINQISIHYPMVLVDKYVVMPNHIHMILIIDAGDGGRAMRAPTISTVINQMKGYVTK